MSWDAFAASVTGAQTLAQPDDFDFLHRIGESYATLRRYAPEFLDVRKLRAAPPCARGAEQRRGPQRAGPRRVVQPAIGKPSMRRCCNTCRRQINLTGDYLWRSSTRVGAGKFRPRRPLQPT